MQGCCRRPANDSGLVAVLCFSCAGFSCAGFSCAGYTCEVSLCSVPHPCPLALCTLLQHSLLFSAAVVGHGAASLSALHARCLNLLQCSLPPSTAAVGQGAALPCGQRGAGAGQAGAGAHAAGALCRRKGSQPICSGGGLGRALHQLCVGRSGWAGMSRRGGHCIVRRVLTRTALQRRWACSVRGVCQWSRLCLCQPAVKRAEGPHGILTASPLRMCPLLCAGGASAGAVAGGDRAGGQGRN